VLDPSLQTLGMNRAVAIHFVRRRLPPADATADRQGRTRMSTPGR
jgi:hypothetical protein